MFSEITMIDYARPLKARAEARKTCGPYRWKPATPGKGRGFLAGWTMGPGMCASLDAYIYKAPEDAAHAAHSMAESDAEKNREADEEQEGEDA